MVKIRKKSSYILLGAFSFLVLLLVYFILAILIYPPKPADKSALNLRVTRKGKDFYTCGNNWLKKSENGFYEMYVEGEAFERGVINGKLTKQLAEKQEDYFIGQIKNMIPSMAYLHFLKFFVAWFNRHLDTFIPEEYRLEIYGVSTSASDKYTSIGPKYQRMINYHAAHDIGHFLQEKNLVVGCTSFSAWDEKSEDSSLIVGRNFDFYVGDNFAKNKIISFTNPEKGHKFMTVTWAGMIGAVSGMNDQGLCITINAAKSDIPTSSATPIALVAREILQYAGNIQEAMNIAESRKIFIAQSILIGSAHDNRTAIIEKTIEQTSLFESDTNFIVCANHFQSEALKNEKLNVEHKQESHSLYRFQRLNQLLGQYPKISVSNAAAILRNRQGLNGKDIGMGNEKSLNHLIAHHSIIFKPAKGLVWISTSPFQLGKYVAYDLNKVFSQDVALQSSKEITEANLTIPEDPFLRSAEYRNFNCYKSLLSKIKQNPDLVLSKAEADKFINYNPEFYLVYETLGDHFKQQKKYAEAKYYYATALTKEIPWKNDADKIRKHLNSLPVEKN